MSLAGYLLKRTLTVYLTSTVHGQVRAELGVIPAIGQHSHTYSPQSTSACDLACSLIITAASQLHH